MGQNPEEQVPAAHTPEEIEEQERYEQWVKDHPEDKIEPEALEKDKEQFVDEIDKAVAVLETSRSADEREDMRVQWESEHDAEEMSRRGETLSIPDSEIPKSIVILKQMYITFELTHSLEELNSIVDLKPEDAVNYPERESAKARLQHMNLLLNALPEGFPKLLDDYRRFSRAVGIIDARTNKVDHNR